LLTISKYLVVDGYFMKKEFIIPIRNAGMHVITKMRSDANLCYAVREQDQPKGRGRKRTKGEKINLNKIDKRKWTLLEADKEKGIAIYTTIVFCVILKQLVRVVYILDTEIQKYDVLLSTDTTLDGKKILAYYRSRFQIEFLLRDAKQHTGLEDCQARNKNKLHFHFNISLTSVSIAKICHHLSVREQERGAFSLQSIKRLYHNKLLTETIFDNLALDLNCRKIKQLYEQCLDFGRMAA